MNTASKWLLVLLFSISRGPFALAAKEVALKVAILDQLQSQKFSSEKYERDYFDGLDVAVSIARDRGIRIESKHFSYGREPLDILEGVKQVKEWKPDFVVGPRSSNKFLLLKDQFSGVLVISPLATASTVASLPDNFYSLTLPNEFATKAMVNFVMRDFPRRDVFMVLESACKNCVDYGETFKNLLKERSKKISIQETRFADGTEETVDIKTLTAGYKKGNLILMPNTSYASGVLIPKISDLLAVNDLVFLGGDDWGAWKSGYVGKVKSKYSYTAYRIGPWALEDKSSDVTKFKREFKRRKNKEASDTISYISYRTLMSVIESVKKSDLEKSQDLKITILSSFQAAKKKKENWFRNPSYAIYKLNQDGEIYAGSISPYSKK